MDAANIGIDTSAASICSVRSCRQQTERGTSKVQRHDEAVSLVPKRRSRSRLRSAHHVVTSRLTRSAHRFLLAVYC